MGFLINSDAGAQEDNPYHKVTGQFLRPGQGRMKDEPENYLEKNYYHHNSKEDTHYVLHKTVDFLEKVFEKKHGSPLLTKKP
jgi:hypothetical protein